MFVSFIFCVVFNFRYKPHDTIFWRIYSGEASNPKIQKTKWFSPTQYNNYYYFDDRKTHVFNLSVLFEKNYTNKKNVVLSNKNFATAPAFSWDWGFSIMLFSKLCESEFSMETNNRWWWWSYEDDQLRSGPFFHYYICFLSFYIVVEFLFDFVDTNRVCVSYRELCYR